MKLDTPGGAQPATGLPTTRDQADLNFLLSSLYTSMVTKDKFFTFPAIV